MKIAGSYLFNDQFIVGAKACTVDGIWIGWEPLIKLRANASPTEIGQAILTALDGSELDVPHPTNWKAIDSAFLKFVGARSFKAFHGSSKHVEIEEDGGDLTLTPYVMSTDGKGLDPDNSRKVVATGDNPALLATKLRELFDTSP